MCACLLVCDLFLFGAVYGFGFILAFVRLWFCVFGACKPAKQANRQAIKCADNEQPSKQTGKWQGHCSNVQLYKVNMTAAQGFNQGTEQGAEQGAE